MQLYESTLECFVQYIPPGLGWPDVLDCSFHNFLLYDQMPCQQEIMWAEAQPIQKTIETILLETKYLNGIYHYPWIRSVTIFHLCTLIILNTTTVEGGCLINDCFHLFIYSTISMLSDVDPYHIFFFEQYQFWIYKRHLLKDPQFCSSVLSWQSSTPSHR